MDRGHRPLLWLRGCGRPGRVGKPAPADPYTVGLALRRLSGLAGPLLVRPGACSGDDRSSDSLPDLVPPGALDRRGEPAPVRRAVRQVRVRVRVRPLQGEQGVRATRREGYRNRTPRPRRGSPDLDTRGYKAHAHL